MLTPPKTLSPRTVFTVNILAGAAFLLIGIHLSYADVIRLLSFCAQARAWTPTPARVIELEIKSGSGGGRSPSGSSRIHILYQYEFNGHTHTSATFTPFGAGDNFTTYHRRNYDRYKPHFDSQTPVTCLVNPADPTQALIDPAPRPVILLLGSVFAILFTFSGLAILLNARRLLHPNK